MSNLWHRTFVALTRRRSKWRPDEQTPNTNYWALCPGCLDFHKFDWCHRFLWRCFDGISGCKSSHFKTCPNCDGLYCPACEPGGGRWCSSGIIKSGS